MITTIETHHGLSGAPGIRVPSPDPVVLEESHTYNETVETTLTGDTVTVQRIGEFDDARSGFRETLTWPADRHADVVVMLALLRPDLVAGIVARLEGVRG